QREQVRLAREWSFCFRLLHDVLAEVWHLAIAIMLVESDDVFQRTHRRLWSQTREVSVEIGFELIQQDLKLRSIKLARGRNVSRIDKHRAEFFHLGDAIVHQLVDAVADA